MSVVQKTSRGVNIAELSMRTWVLQPGFMITHWEHLKHASLTLLGIITLTAAFVSMFYTTASDSLVSPHLKYGRPTDKLMYGLVKTSYANPSYISSNCQTPIKYYEDPLYAGTTCVAIENAGQAYQNLLGYLATFKSSNNTSTDLPKRPPPTAILMDNTTAVSVTGSWVQTNNSDINIASKLHKRVINNITMSHPHALVASAAKDDRNAIMQPEDLEGVGEFSVEASIVSPTVNVLCVNMAAAELSPLIYVDWPNALTNDSLDLPGQKLAWQHYENDISKAVLEHPFLNTTVVDDVFQWGATYNKPPPVFPMLPIDYNSLLNISVSQSDSNYVLFKSPNITDYTICQIRSWLSSDCSTQYNVSGTAGGHLRSNCEVTSNDLAYKHNNPKAPAFTLSNDYRNVASTVLMSLSLNTGVTNADASSARLLTQFIPTFYGNATSFALNSTKPSLAEALAVIAGSSLLISTQDAQPYHFWDFNETMLSQPKYLPFKASLASQEYTSGPTANWQKMFYLVLVLVLLTNIFCLVYLFWTSGLVTDYTETQNLFALAVNSPPSRRLSGSCGAGPSGDQLDVDWHVNCDEGSSHFFIKEGLATNGAEVLMRKRKQTFTSTKSYDKLSRGRRAWL